MHDANVFGINSWRVVDAGAGNIKERTLLHNTQRCITRINQGYPLGVAQVAIFFSARPLRPRVAPVSDTILPLGVPGSCLLSCACRRTDRPHVPSRRFSNS